MHRPRLFTLSCVISTFVGASALTGNPIDQKAYVKASNTGTADHFGNAVAVSGNTLVVGAVHEDSNAVGVNGPQANDFGSESGAAYVFVRTGTTWTQQAYLKASNAGLNDEFGRSVAIAGDTIVIGAWAEDSAATGVNGNQNDNSKTDSGAAYVFVRNGSSWSQQAYLKASNSDSNDFFGTSVSISGETIVVGAQSERSNATGVNGNQGNNDVLASGAAYIFVREGSNWTQQAYLKASNTDMGDGFGAAAAISGDTVVIGADGESSAATGINGDQANNGAYDSGAAYVFVRNGSTWTQQAYLKSSNTGANNYFGVSVAVSNDTVVVGAEGEESAAMGVNGDQNNENAQSAGAAYVFVRSGAAWSQQAYLKASNTGPSRWFGFRTAIDDETIVIGSHGESSNATGVNGNQTDSSALYAGAAYAFSRSGSTWTQHAYLKASNTSANVFFGCAVGVSDNTIVIGATHESSNATGIDGNQANILAPHSGAGYIFEACSNVRGDMNCNCITNMDDLAAFLLALVDPVGHAMAYPGCLLNGDTNSDGLVNGADIQGFVELLVP